MSSVDEVKARAEALQAELQKKAQNFVPAEYKVSAQWESCAGNTLKQMSIGAFGGAVVASVLAPRIPSLRWSIVTGFAGVGIGRAWQQCSAEFEKLSEKAGSDDA